MQKLIENMEIFAMMYGMNRYDQALRYEIFEKWEYALAKEAILEAEVIFDIWSHLGFFAERCRALGSQADIYCFEPIVEIYETAKKRLNWDERIRFFPFWIGITDEKTEFFLNEEKTMQSGKYESFLNRKGKRVPVDLKRLKLPNDWGLEVDNQKIFVKMDIEGMEYEVLESWDEKLWNKISSLVMEVHFLKTWDEARWGKLRSQLKSLFSSLVEEPSTYDERVRLAFLCWPTHF